MIRCQSCGNKNSDTAQYCDECGTKLAGKDIAGSMVSVVSEPVSHGNIPDFSVHSTSSGVPAIVERLENEESRLPENRAEHASGRHAILYIERGDAAATEFSMAGDESNIGRWDADNGIFPDIDLDAYDPDAKVSRRHARIIRRGTSYLIEDLGSTNGTFINRGRRLLPGVPQDLKEGDEIIVGKTFLRFRII
jgi:hypothetical protein